MHRHGLAPAGQHRTPLLLFGDLLAGPAGSPARGNRGLTQVTGPVSPAVLIDQMRADGVVLIYDPDSRTLRAGGHDAPSVTIGKDH